MQAVIADKNAINMLYKHNPGFDQIRRLRLIPHCTLTDILTSSPVFNAGRRPTGPRVSCGVQEPISCSQGDLKTVSLHPSLKP